MLSIGLHRQQSRNKQAEPAASAPQAWIRLHPDNTLTVVINHAEMGQGITTALAMIVAEELEADWAGVNFAMAPVAEVYKHPHYGMQWTVSSRSVESSWLILRQAGASLRELLRRAAATTWQVPLDSCQAREGRIHHAPSDRSLTYGELLQTAAGLPLPSAPPLKSPSEFRLIGRPLARLDAAAKINGSALFGTDIRLPGLLHATVLHPPVYGEQSQAIINEAAIRQLPGVRAVVRITTGVAIVAETVWQAMAASEQLRIQWLPLAKRRIDSEQLWQRWKQRGRTPGRIIHGQGEQLTEAGQSWTIEASYDLPYQAHATMEPMNCTAEVGKDYCHLWVPTQNPQGARDIAARRTGLAPQQVQVQTTFLGCGFGRRALVDYVGEAVELSMHMEAPVQVLWSREEDLRRDYYRPGTHNLLKAVVDERGHPTAWLHRIVGADAFGQAMPQVIPAMLGERVPNLVKNGVARVAEALGPRLIPGKKAGIGAGPLPYTLPRMQVEFINDDPGFPVCWWRSVAPSSNCFAVECFVDEIATRSGRDPLDLRLELLADNPRLRAVVQEVAARYGWRQQRQVGRFAGLACQDFQDTMMAMVAEVSVEGGHRVRVHRVVCALDCGVAINPKIIHAQVESGIAFGLTATLKGEITFAQGAARQSNFNDFPLLRFDEMPQVDTHIMESDRAPTGIGEVAVPVIGPAVANAVFAATGRPIRRLPIRLLT